MRAPGCCRNGKSSHLVREEPGPSARSVGGVRQHNNRSGRTRQSTLRPAFHNALGCLQPCRQSIRTGFFPARGYWGQSALFAFALKTEPAVAELAGNDNLATELAPTTLGRLPPISEPFRHTTGGFARATIDPSSLRCGRCHQPNFPAPARRVRERPITQCASSVADSAPWSTPRAFCSAG
jgi:hypothetical protein